VSAESSPAGGEVLRRYPLRDRLAGKEPVIGTAIGFSSPDAVEFAAAMGFDFVMIDCQHGPMDPGSVLDMIRAAEGTTIAPLVRVASHEAHEAQRFLDIGAVGIVFPEVSSAREAAQIVASIKYPPEGVRGITPVVRSAGYGVVSSAADYMREANEETMAVPIIESPAGIQAIDEILRVPGIDAIGIGANDLAISMGYADRDAPAVRRAVEEVVAACRRHGKPSLMAAASQPQLRALVEMGATMLMVPFGHWLIQLGRGFLQELRRADG
jgi:2-keto-3-deoxy-L-rhamnonate aldolase RhmA